MRHRGQPVPDPLEIALGQGRSRFHPVDVHQLPDGLLAGQDPLIEVAGVDLAAAIEQMELEGMLDTEPAVFTKRFAQADS